LNNDVEVLDADWLEELVRWAERPEIGAVGAKLLFPNGTIQHAGIVIGLTGHAGHVFAGSSEGACGPFGSPNWYRNPLAVTGACMMVRRSAFNEVGGFDEEYELAFSDVALCLHLVNRGYRNVYTPFARLLHHEGASRTQGAPARDMLRGFREMEAVISRGDPSFNPNLSLSTRDPSVTTRHEGIPAEHLRRLLGLN
jgi:GT2 family glycosyltransferase